MTSPIELLAEIVREFTEEDIWTGSPVEAYRRLGNTNRGEAGEEFVRRFLKQSGIKVGNGGRTSETDIRIDDFISEVKTASLGANGTFQFNHIRLDRAYRLLLVIGICPNKVTFNGWRKGDVAEGAAGTLVSMARGQNVTFKLTKKLEDMRPIEELPDFIRSFKGQ